MKTKTMMDQMNAEDPDKVLDELEAKRKAIPDKISETSLVSPSERWACACVSPDPRECARLRDGPQYYNLKRLCECICHKDYYDEDEEDL